MKKAKEILFKNAEDYFAFTKKHNVFGAAALKLKEQMIKLEKLIMGKEPKR